MCNTSSRINDIESQERQVVFALSYYVSNISVTSISGDYAMNVNYNLRKLLDKKRVISFRLSSEPSNQPLKEMLIEINKQIAQTLGLI